MKKKKSNIKILDGAVEMPAGEYIIGDPCYSVPNDRWMEWLNAADYMNPDKSVIAAELDGYPIVGVNTMYGDGTYYDQFGNAYDVDAGLIGLVSTSIGNWDVGGEPSIVTFSTPFECFRDGGVIHLGSYEIQTDDENDDEDDW